MTKSHASIALLFIVLSAVMTWPLVWNIDRAVSWPGDPYINTWILDWDWYATFHQPLSLFQANAFYPARDSLAYSENLYGIALLLFPLRAAGVMPLTAYNIALLAGYAFSGFAAYLLGRYLTGSLLAGVAAGVFFAFVPFRFTQAPHVQHVWGGWLPLLLLMLFRYADQPSWRRASAFAAVFLMNGLSNIHALLFGTIAIAATALLLRPRPLPLIACSSVAAAMLAPFLLPYYEISKLYGMQRGWRETRIFSARPGDWLVSNVNNHLYSLLNDASLDAERWLFPGALCLLVATAAVASRNRRAAFAGLLWVVLGFAGSLGTHMVFHRFLFRHVVGFRAIRVPARWAMITYVGLAVLVALGTAVLSRRWKWLSAIVAVAFVLELWSAPIRWYMTVTTVLPVDRWIVETKPRAIIELPMDMNSEYAHLLRATVHHRPMVNGISGFSPPETMRLSAAAQRDPIPDSWIDELRRIGCEIVVVHGDAVAANVRPWIARETARGRLEFVRRFDHGIWGDWVFRIGGGATRPSPELDAFLHGQASFNDTPFGTMDWPPAGARSVDSASFVGWAFSPYGIREIHLLFNNGLIRQTTTLLPDADLHRLFPFYDATQRPRFSRLFDRRPPGMWEATDVQAEIIDGRGRRVLLEDRFIEWAASSR